MQQPQSVSEFMTHFTRNEPRLRGFVLALVPHWADAEEILQRTNSVLWEKFGRFEPGSDFFAWSCQIARYEVLHHRRSQARQRVYFDQSLLDELASEMATMRDEFDERLSALTECVGRLKEGDRRLIAARYEEGGTAASAASAVGRSVDAAYKSLARVRKALMDCIERAIAQKGV